MRHWMGFGVGSLPVFERLQYRACKCRKGTGASSTAGDATAESVGIILGSENTETMERLYDIDKDDIPELLMRYGGGEVFYGVKADGFGGDTGWIVMEQYLQPGGMAEYESIMAYLSPGNTGVFAGIRRYPTDTTPKRCWYELRL